MSNQYNDMLMADIQRVTKGETLDKKKNLALFQRVAAGDATAREEMIAGNMPLAISNVESFVASFPGIEYLRDDLTSAAFVGLTKAVNKMAAGKGPRSTAPSAPVEFMGMWINRELRQVIESASLVQQPPRSRYRARAQGAEVVPPTVENVVPERFEVPSYQKQLEDRDLIESCCTCDEERIIVAMQMSGYTLMEIASAINKTRMTAQRMQKKLYARIRHKLEALRDE